MTEIAIIDDQQAQVAKLLWDGDLYTGTAKIQAIPGRERMAANIIGMMRMRQDLAGVMFRSAGQATEVAGWQAFEGTLDAMRIILPPLGLQLGRLDGKIPPVGKNRRLEMNDNIESGYIE